MKPIITKNVSKRYLHSQPVLQGFPHAPSIDYQA